MKYVINKHLLHIQEKEGKHKSLMLITNTKHAVHSLLLDAPVHRQAGEGEANLMSGLGKGSGHKSPERLCPNLRNWFSSFSPYNVDKYALFKLFKLMEPLKAVSCNLSIETKVKQELL